MSARSTLRLTAREVERLLGVVRDARAGCGFRERWLAIDEALALALPATALNVATYFRPAVELPTTPSGLVHFRPGEERLANHYFGRNFDMSAMASYMAHYAEHDPTAPAYIHGNGAVQRHSEIVPDGVWGRDACTGEYLPHHGVRRVIGFVAPLGERTGLSFGLYRDGGCDFADREKRMLQLLVPYLVDATRGALADEQAAGAGRSPGGTTGTILLSRRGEVESAEATARALLGRVVGRRPPSAVLAAVVREARVVAPLRGGGWLELTAVQVPSLAGKVAVFLRPLEPGTQPHVDAAADGAGLSPRERHVAALAMRGLANKEIALELGITLDTAKEYLSSAYRKTGADGRAALAAYLLGDD